MFLQHKMFFRHFKQLTCSCSKVVHIMRHYSANFQTKHLLSEYFGLTISQVDYITNKYKLHNVKHENLLDALKFFQENGFSKEQVLTYPPVLNMHPVSLEQKYLLFKETGFIRISPRILSKFRKLYSKNVRMLKLQGFLPRDLNVAENYKRYLKPLPQDFDVSDLNDDKILMELHLMLVKRYLAWRLEATPDEIERVFRIYKMIKNKSLQILCENIAIAEDIGFTPRRLLRYAYLLHNLPRYTKTALKEFANIAGADLKKSMKEYPKLIMVSPRNYVKIYGILKEHNISDETIRKSMNIFHLSPETVKLRLQEIESVPELRALLCNPKILKLIVHHNRARSRLSFLQQLELKCASVTVLGSCPDSFDSHIKQGKDTNPYYEVQLYLKSLLGTEKIDFEKFKKHPFYLNIPYVQMEETFGYLKSLKYSNSSIVKAVHILLYPREHVEEALNKIRKQITERVQRLSQVEQLNLILYFIEKEHHFTGNGVWRTSK